ncbi:MAG: hypothetical protein AAF653_16860 [Chloroflexota bacterium]
MIAIALLFLLIVIMTMILVSLPVYFLFVSLSVKFIMRGYTGDDFWRRVGLSVVASLLLNTAIVIAGRIVIADFAGDSLVDGVAVAVERALPILIAAHWLGFVLYFGIVWRWTQSADRSTVRTDMNALFGAGGQPRKRKTQDEAATDAPRPLKFPTVRAVLMPYLRYAVTGVGLVTGLLIAAFSVERGSAYVATLIFGTLFTGFITGVVSFLLLAFTLPLLRLAMRGYNSENEFPTQVRLVIYVVLVDALLALLSVGIVEDIEQPTATLIGIFFGLTALVHNAGVVVYYRRVRLWSRQRTTAT